MDLLYVFLVAGVVCLCLMPLAVTLANRLNLLDHPSGRKQHVRPTPLVGGIVIFSAWIFSTVVFDSPAGFLPFQMWISIVLVVGVLDDYLDLSKRVRVLTHCLVVVGIWISDGLMVESIGVIFGGTEPVVFSLVAGLIFTAIAVIGAVNAVNMIDGVDGLLGSLLFISIISLLFISELGSQVAYHDRVFTSVTIVALLGAVLAFLMLNARVFGRAYAKIYMGDAGSTVLGFLLVYMLIDFTQGENALFSPVVAGWILGVPLLDASAVIVKRVLQRQSPFAPGRDHLHHILLQQGLSTNQTVARLVILHVAMISLAVLMEVAGNPYADLMLFWLFVALVIARVIGTIKVKNPVVAVDGKIK